MHAILPVILSEAKDLCVRRARSFAEFPLERSEGLRMTGIISKCLFRLFAYGFLAVNAVELEHYAIISLKKLLLLKERLLHDHPHSLDRPC